MKELMVMCNVYKLLRDGNHFSKESKKLIREKIILSRDYVEEKNKNCLENGIWHEKLEKETSEAYEYGKILAKKRLEDEKVADKLKDVLTDVIKKGTKKKVYKKDELSILRKSYEDKFNKKAFNGWSIEKLKEKLK